MNLIHQMDNISALQKKKRKEKNRVVLGQILILEQLTAILRSQLIEHCYTDPVNQGPSFPQVK